MHLLSLTPPPGGPAPINVQVRASGPTERTLAGLKVGRLGFEAEPCTTGRDLGPPRRLPELGFPPAAGGRGAPSAPRQPPARCDLPKVTLPRPRASAREREGSQAPGQRPRTPPPGFGVGAGAGRSRGAARADAGPRDAPGTGRGGRRLRRASSFCASAGCSASRR